MKILFSFAVALLLVSDTFAQINIGGKPYSFKNDIADEEYPVVSMPLFNLGEVEKEDLKDDQAGLPPRFGYPFGVQLNLENSGTWTTLDNGDRIWRLSVSSPGARSINLTYDAFWLPQGAALYIYNKSQSQVIGGFTSKNNNSPKGQSIGFATGFIFSDQITLEYYEPQSVMGAGEISIDQVVHGYRNIRSPGSPDDFGTSGGCNVNINCSPEGDIWQAVKHSVAMIMVGGFRFCTGSLLNTTVADFKPYFLTANHCLSGTMDALTDPMVGNWMFVWNYESAGCANGATEPALITTTGAILVANNGGSDFALFRLIEDPLELMPSVPLWYNGWDASASASAGGVGIHHPDGDIKKISTYSMTPGSSGNFWTVFFDPTTNGHGVTEPGSSGSPLFNSSQRVIGQLQGGIGSSCGDPVNDESFYGKFSDSWDGANQRRRLHDWLDPDCPVNLAMNTNITIGGHVFYASEEITSTANISPNTVVDFSAGFQIRLLPGFRAEMGSFFSAKIRGCMPMANRPDADALSGSFIGAGTCIPPNNSERLDIGSRETRSSQLEDTGFQCYPNPFSGDLFVRFEVYEPTTQVSVSISDAFGRQVHQPPPQRPFDAGQHTIQVEYGQLPPGLYYITLNTPDGRWTKKVVKSD